MSEKPDNEEHEKTHEEGATFDMYHFFSRKDVIIAALFILALLIFFVFKLTAGAPAA